MATINDANGTPAKVNSKGKLKVYAVTEPEGLHINEDDGEAYTVMIDVTTSSTDDDFFYLQNTNDVPLIVTKIEGWCANANQEIQVAIGGTSDGTGAGDTLTPANMNAGSGNTADVICTQDATDLAIPGGRTVRLLKFPTTALEREDFHFPEGVILPKNQRLHMQAALAGLININVSFYYHD